MEHDPIKAKIIELVPEIMELKFGCRIEKDGETYSLAIESDEGIFSKTTAGMWFTVNKNNQAIALEKNIRTKILGRPITLADVLRAIGGSENMHRFSTSLYGTKLHFGYLDEEGYQSNYNWNLTTDYDGQTQEVKDFIGSLLGV